MEQASTNPEEVQRQPESSPDLQEELIESKVDAALDEDSRTADLLQQIQAARGKPEEANLVLRMKQLREVTREQVEKGLGIYRSAEEEKVQLEATHRQNLKEVLAGIKGDEKEEELLAKLGMVGKDGRFEFPEQIFSPESGRLWRNYLRTVEKAAGAMNLANELHINSSDVAKLDWLRVKAHDEITEAIRQELGGNMQFEDVRRLVAKMRDMEIPNSGELKTTASAAMDLVEKARKEFDEEAA